MQGVGQTGQLVLSLINSNDKTISESELTLS